MTAHERQSLQETTYGLSSEDVKGRATQTSQGGQSAQGGGAAGERSRQGKAACDQGARARPCTACCEKAGGQGRPGRAQAGGPQVGSRNEQHNGAD